MGGFSYPNIFSREGIGPVAFIQLNSELYPLVSKMLTGLESSFSPSPLSILEQTIDGRVFVNREDNPTCAAVMSTNLVGGRLIGHADDPSFNHAFIAYMLQHWSGKGARHPIFWSTVSETWDEVVFRIFGYRALRIDRTQFRFNERTFKALGVKPIPEDAHVILQRIDSNILAQHDALRRELEGLWGSSDQFLKFGGGWIAISEENQIVGRCNSAFVGGESSELAIWIDKSFRGKGLAGSLCQHFIADCLNRGIVPNWTCDTSNTASYDLAKKMGFEPLQTYFLFISASTYTPMYHEPARSR